MTKSDANLGTAVAQELAADPGVNERDITVVVNDGFVTLSGSVKRGAQKSAAEQAVRRVRGVVGISTVLAVDRPTDAELVRSMREAARGSTLAPGARDSLERIDIEATDGTMTLRGWVRSWEERQAAAAIAYAVAGVVDVKNLTVVSERNSRPAPKGIRMLKAGDRVYIDGTNQEGTVKEVHAHEVLVRVQVPGGHEDRKYANESLRLDPTLNEASRFVDH